MTRDLFEGLAVLAAVTSFVLVLGVLLGTL
jgi:hypothetical protein